MTQIIKKFGLDNKILQFFYSIILYLFFYFSTGYFFVLPDKSLLSLAGFVPTFLGLLWGPVAAFGCMIGALLSEYQDFLILPKLLRDEGIYSCLWTGTLLFCNCGFWAFIAAYMPWRLNYSIFVDSRSFSYLRGFTILKFALLMFITSLTTSLFLAMTTEEADMLKLIEGIELNLGVQGEYALTNFFNDFDSSIFVGVMLFFFLRSYDYPFCRPSQKIIVPHPYRQKIFDMFYIFAVALSLTLCQPSMIEREGMRFFAGILLCVYMFRPLSPLPKTVMNKHEKIINQDDIQTSRKIATCFYIFFVVLFSVLDLSGMIYGMENMNTWRQFNAECITMMDISLVALLCMLLRYHRSIMTNIVMLEVVTVFISSFALGAVCLWVTNKVMVQGTEDSLSEMSIICRERLEKTFNNIQISVNDIRDLALSKLESYERLTEDENWRRNYLQETENLFRVIASNTEGSVAFYLRLSPDYAGPLGGFSWGREKDNWEGAATKFYKRTPIDLSKYKPDDFENVGWYYIPISRKKSTWIEPYIDPTVQTYVISYVSPFYIEGKLVGVVGMDIDFEYLIHEVKGMSVYDYGFAYLIDRKGHVLYHKDFKQGEIFKPNEKYRELETYLSNGIWIGIATPLTDIYTERNNLLMHIVCVMLIITILVSSFSIYLASRGIRPLLILTKAAQKIANGNLNVKLPHESGNELGTLVKSIREMVSKLEIYVYRDKLTGLSNTTAYARKCEELAEKAESNFEYAVVVFDVNFLKKINDNYGHEAGNELIRTAANIISETFSNSTVFRIGGDEFVAILEGQDYDDREELIENFDAAAAEKTFTAQNETFSLSIARGVGIWKKGMEYAEVFQTADEKMYAHKTEIKKALGVELR